MFSGNQIFESDYYTPKPTLSENQRQIFTIVGTAKITDTNQVNIPIMVRSHKPESLQSESPPKQLILPANAQILRVDARLPKQASLGDEPIVGIDLPRSCNITGVATEHLRVTSVVGGLATAGVSPIQCQATAQGPLYTPNASFVYARAYGEANQAGGSILTTIASATAFQVTCTTTSLAPSPLGFRLTKIGSVAYMFVRIIYSLPGEAVKPWCLDLLPTP